MRHFDTTVLVPAAVPPPVHGQSLVTGEVVARLKATGACRVILADTSPGGLKRNLGYHALRALRIARAALAALQGATSIRRRAYTTMDAGLGLVYNFALVAWLRLLGYEIFVHHHTAAYLRERKATVAGFVKLAGRNCVHIALSDAMAADFKRLYPDAGTVRVGHNACHVIVPDQPPQVRPTPVAVGLLSNLAAEKGLDLAIDTCAAARRAGLAVRLVLAGPAVGTEAEDSIRQAKAVLGDALDYRGAVAGEAKRRFFEDIDVFLFPTLYRNEAQPLVVLEAMSFGRPVIVNDRGYTRELVGECGVVVGPDENYSQIAVSTLRAWTEDPAAFAAAARRSRERFAELRELAAKQLDEMIVALSGADG